MCASASSGGHGVADRSETVQQLSQSQASFSRVAARLVRFVVLADGVLKRFAANETHSVAGLSLGVLT
jgi:hypothetical protein